MHFELGVNCVVCAVTIMLLSMSLETNQQCFLFFFSFFVCLTAQARKPGIPKHTASVFLLERNAI